MSLLTITSPLDLTSLGCGSGCHFVNIGIVQYDYSFIFSIAHTYWFLWYDVWITQCCLSMCAQCICDWGQRKYTLLNGLNTFLSQECIYICVCCWGVCVQCRALLNNNRPLLKRLLSVCPEKHIPQWEKAFLRNHGWYTQLWVTEVWVTSSELDRSVPRAEHNFFAEWSTLGRKLTLAGIDWSFWFSQTVMCDMLIS